MSLDNATSSRRPSTSDVRRDVRSPGAAAVGFPRRPEAARPEAAAERPRARAIGSLAAGESVINGIASMIQPDGSDGPPANCDKPRVVGLQRPGRRGVPACSEAETPYGPDVRGRGLSCPDRGRESDRPGSHGPASPGERRAVIGPTRRRSRCRPVLIGAVASAAMTGSGPAVGLGTPQRLAGAALPTSLEAIVPELPAVGALKPVLDQRRHHAPTITAPAQHEHVIRPDRQPRRPPRMARLRAGDPIRWPILEAAQLGGSHEVRSCLRDRLRDVDGQALRPDRRQRGPRAPEQQPDVRADAPPPLRSSVVAHDQRRRAAKRRERLDREKRGGRQRGSGTCNGRNHGTSFIIASCRNESKSD